MSEGLHEGCPYASAGSERSEVVAPEYTQEPTPDGMPSPDDYRLMMLDWYQKTGFRGCLFNKVAARDARRGTYNWLTPVEYANGDNVIEDVASQRIVENFDSIIGDGDKPGLVSYMFPEVMQPRQLGNILKALNERDPQRFQLFDSQDRITETALGKEFVGIQFRIKVGETSDGQDALAYPMIYNPWPFTTYARRFDVPMITFNRFNAKENHETADTYIGVDDVDLGLTPETFGHMLEKSLAVNKQAHSVSGGVGEDYYFNRKLFRAHNALVLPSDEWDEL